MRILWDPIEFHKILYDHIIENLENYLAVYNSNKSHGVVYGFISDDIWALEDPIGSNYVLYDHIFEIIGNYMTVCNPIKSQWSLYGFIFDDMRTL